MKLPKAKLVELEIVELSGVDRPCHAPALVALMKRAPVDPRRTAKSATAMFTSEVDGHQHRICSGDDGSLWAEYATADGAEYGHSHGIVRADDGTLTVLADSGHTHDVLPEQAAPTTTTTIVQASARNSTRPAQTAKVSAHTEKNMTLEEALAEIADLKAKLAELEKTSEEKLEEAEKRASLTDAQRAYHKSLDAKDAKAFLAKSFKERQAILDEIEKANEVVYTSKSTGETFRKSDDPRLVAMAKRQDEQAAELAKRDEAIEKAEIRSIAKSVLGNVAGDDDVHDYIVRSVRKGGGDAALVEKALDTLKGANALCGEKGVAKGASGGMEPRGSAAEQLETLITKYAAEHKVPRHEATVAVTKTAEGRRLYAESNR